MKNMMDYNEVTFNWADGHQYQPAPRHRRRLISNILKNLPFDTCLDAGCAQPHLLEILSKWNKDLYGCDVSHKVITANKEEFKHISFETMDITKETYPGNKTFDLVICSEVIEHLDDWQSAVKNLSVMSKKYLLITVPSGKMNPIDGMLGHIRHFKGDELTREIEKNGFKVILSRYWGFPVHSLYKFAINSVAPDKLYEKFAMSKFTPFKKIVCNILYYSFYINDLFKRGKQLILLAEKNNEAL